MAAELGRRLGWPVYDREILDKIGADMRRPPQHLHALDERPASWLEEFLAGLTSQHSVSAARYLKFLVGAVRGLGEIGRCVIVGRGANFILPAATTLRVRLVASAEDRARVIAEQARQVAAQSKADMEFLAREVASLRMALGEVATRDFLRSELSRVEAAREREEERVD